MKPKEIDASLKAAHKKAAQELKYRAMAQAAMGGGQWLHDEMERLKTLPPVEYKPRVKIERFKGSEYVRRLDIHLPERQILTLRYMAELDQTTMSEQVRPILDAVLRINDSVGGTVHRKYQHASQDLRRTTLYLTEREVSAIKAKSKTQHATLSFVIRRVLDMYLFGE